RIQPAEYGDHGAELTSNGVDEQVQCELRLRIFRGEQYAHVAGDPRHAQESGVVVQQRFDGAGIHFQLVHHEEHHARVEVAATSAHGQASESSKPHGTGHALAGLHGANACAVTQVHHNSPAAGRTTVVLR